jgi:hypothetical protein
MACSPLVAGVRVAGTLRDEEERRAFGALASERSVGVILDVTDHAKVGPTVERIEREVGEGAAK